MDLNQGGTGDVRPRLLPRECGGWLAVSPVWARFSLGVVAPTEQEAREKFDSVFKHWVSMLDDTVQENT